MTSALGINLEGVSVVAAPQKSLPLPLELGRYRPCTHQYIWEVGSALPPPSGGFALGCTALCLGWGQGVERGENPGIPQHYLFFSSSILSLHCYRSSLRHGSCHPRTPSGKTRLHPQHPPLVNRISHSTPPNATGTEENCYASVNLN